MSNVIPLFRNESVINENKRFSIRVYEFLDAVVDNIKSLNTSLSSLQTQVNSLEGGNITVDGSTDLSAVNASIAALDSRVDTLEVNDNFNRTFMMMGA